MRKLSWIALVMGMTCVVPAVASAMPEACGQGTFDFEISKHKAPKGKAIAEPVAEKARLVFVQRSVACLGCSLTRIGIDGEWVGGNKGKSYSTYVVEPGEHHVCTDWSAPLATTEKRIGLTELTAKPGQIYYFGITIELDSEGIPREVLSPLSTDEGVFLASRSPESVATPKEKKP